MCLILIDRYRAPGLEVVDSAGVTIVHNGIGPDRSSHQWTVATNPRVSIGTVEGDPEDMLYRVSGATMLPNGHTVVASSGSKTIRIFDASGRFVREFGGEGQGPGEFIVPTQIVFVEPGTIVVLDRPRLRLTWFTTQGNLVRTESIDPNKLNEVVQPRFSTGTAWFLADGDLFVTIYEPGGYEKYGDGPFRGLDGYLRMSGDFADVDTLGFYGGIEQMYVTALGFPTAAGRPYGRQTVWSFNGQPSRVCIGEQAEPRVDCFEAQRRLSLRWDQESHRITDADMDAWEQRTRESMGHLTDQQVNRMIDQLTHGPFMPAYGAIHVDKLRHTWVAFGPPETPSRRGQYRIFDTEGRMVAYALVPDLKIMEIGSDYILGVRIDENDVEFVEVYSLERTPGGS